MKTLKNIVAVLSLTLVEPLAVVGSEEALLSIILFGRVHKILKEINDLD